MKASEARSTAFINANSEIKEIHAQILKAIETKNMSIVVISLSPAAKELLKADGFKIEQLDSPAYSSYVVSW